MEAMIYEHLIRRIYQVGRTDKHGADADIYRKLERAERLYRLDLENIKQKQIRLSTKSIDELEYDFNVQCGRVWHNITSAIQHGITNYGNRFSSDEISTMKGAIDSVENVTKEHIDNTVRLVQDIYVKHEIFAR